MMEDNHIRFIYWGWSLDLVRVNAAKPRRRERARIPSEVSARGRENETVVMSVS